MPVREGVRRTVEASWFQTVTISLILANAVILGCKTSPRTMAAHGDVLMRTDRVVLEELRSLRTEVETLRRERASVEG